MTINLDNTGPPYPAPPPNFIGGFIIGESQIGAIPPFDVWATIIAQYSNSPALTSLIQSWFYALDQTENFDNFYDKIWNVATAFGYGLDVWGRIVGVNRVVQIEEGQFLGFEEAHDSNLTGWNQAPFFSGTGATSNFSLSDDAFRTLIFAKAAANICDGSIPAINKILMSLFGSSGDCYVTDGENMTMTYTFTFKPSPVQAAIIFQSNVLPKPVGVTATIVTPP